MKAFIIAVILLSLGGLSIATGAYMNNKYLINGTKDLNTSQVCAKIESCDPGQKSDHKILQSWYHGDCTQVKCNYKLTDHTKQLVAELDEYELGSGYVMSGTVLLFFGIAIMFYLSDKQYAQKVNSSKA